MSTGWFDGETPCIECGHACTDNALCVDPETDEAQWWCICANEAHSPLPGGSA